MWYSQNGKATREREIEYVKTGIVINASYFVKQLPNREIYSIKALKLKLLT